MRSIASSSSDLAKTPILKSNQQHYDNSGSNRAKGGNSGLTAPLATSNSVGTINLVSGSSPTPGGSKTKRANSIDLPSYSHSNEATKNTLSEPVSRAGRKLPLATGCTDRDAQLSAVKRSSPSSNVERKDNSCSSNVTAFEDPDLSLSLPKRLHRNTLFPQGSISSVDTDYAQQNQGSSISTVSDHGSKFFASNEGASNTHAIVSMSSDVKTPSMKSKRIDFSRINLEGTTSTPLSRKVSIDDEMPVISSRVCQLQSQKIAFIDGSVEGSSSRGKLPPTLMKKSSTSDSDASAPSMQVDGREGIKPNSGNAGGEHYTAELGDNLRNVHRTTEEQPLQKFNTPTKIRGARFVEVASDRISCDVTQKNVSSNSSISDNSFNVVVRDESLALKYDTILQNKLMEAKSLNKRNVTGSTMHVFSLWGGGTGAPINPTPAPVSVPIPTPITVPIPTPVSIPIPTPISIPPIVCVRADSPQLKVTSYVAKEAPFDNYTDRPEPLPKHVIKSPKHAARSPKHQISKLRGPLTVRAMQTSASGSPRLNASHRPTSRRGSGCSTVERIESSESEEVEDEEEEEERAARQREEESYTEEEDQIHGFSEEESTVKVSISISTPVDRDRDRDVEKVPKGLDCRLDSLDVLTSMQPDRFSRMSTQLRTMVGDAQCMGSVSNSRGSGDGEASQKSPSFSVAIAHLRSDGNRNKSMDRSRISGANRESDRERERDRERTFGRSEPKNTRKPSYETTKKDSTPSKPSSLRAVNNFPDIGRDAVIRSSMGFENTRESVMRGEHEVSPPETMSGPVPYNSDCELYEENGYDSELSYALRSDVSGKSSGRVRKGSAVNIAAITAKSRPISNKSVDGSVSDCFNSDTEFDMCSVEEDLVGVPTEEFKRPKGPSGRRRSTKSIRSDKTFIDKSLFGGSTSPNLTSEVLLDSPSVQGVVNKSKGSYVEGRKVQSNAVTHLHMHNSQSPASSLARTQEYATADHSFKSDPASPHFTSTLVRYSNTAPQTHREIIVKTVSPRKFKRVSDIGRDRNRDRERDRVRGAVSLTNTSTEINLKSREREKRHVRASESESKGIKPIKLFTNSMSVKAETLAEQKKEREKEKEKDALRGKARSSSIASAGTLPSKSKSKSGTPPTPTVMENKGSKRAETKTYSASVPVTTTVSPTATAVCRRNRLSKPPALLSPFHSPSLCQSHAPDPSSSSADYDGSHSLLSIATDLQVSPTSLPDLHAILGADLTHPMPMSIPLPVSISTPRQAVQTYARTPELRVPAKESSVSPVREHSTRSKKSVSPHGMEATCVSGRASPTLSELSLEEQCPDSSEESDSTEVVNNILPHHGKSDSHIPVINSMHAATISSSIDRFQNSVPSDVMFKKHSTMDSSPRIRSDSEINEIEVQGPVAGEVSGGVGVISWRRGQHIGEGTFGRVYKGLNERTGESLAVKQISLAEGTKAEVAQLRKEIQVMWNLNHENIVRYLGTSQNEKYLFIILEYVPGGSIHSMLSQFGVFQEPLIWRFSSQILCGVEYLHHRGVIHRDIKGANVLVTDAGVVKLADFGCSKELTGVCTSSLEESLRAIRGSVPWMAPEVIKQSGYGRSSDIWSFGATMIEMATGKPPWPEFTNNLAALFQIATSPVPPPTPKSLSRPCAAFLARCMVIKAADRATASELLKDPFISAGQHSTSQRN